MVIPQEALIERVRSLCLSDLRLDAALTYGSFGSGEGDRFSDNEFWLFFTDDTLASVDSRMWCEQIAPVSLMVLNEFGTQVAILENLVRGEFHFAAASEIDGVLTWPRLSAPVDEMVIVDNRGRTRRCDAVAGRPFAGAVHCRGCGAAVRSLRQLGRVRMAGPTKGVNSSGRCICSTRPTVICCGWRA